MELSTFLNVIFLPIVSIVLPFFLLFEKGKRAELTIPHFVIRRFLLAALGLAFLVFTLLIFLTGGIAQFYYLEKGVFMSSSELRINFTDRWAFIFLFFPGTSFVVISILSGIIYAAQLTLPPSCVIKEVKMAESHLGKTASSSFGAMATASASIVSCCSPSAVAILSPVAASLVAPFIEELIVLSFILLNYSFIKIVIPRFSAT